MTLLSLWPIPERALRQEIDKVSRVVVAELNNGQLRREIERLACDGTEVCGVHRLDGELIPPGQILRAGGLQ